MKGEYVAPPNNLLFRLPTQGDPFKYAVDTEGRLILVRTEGDETDYLFVDSSIEGYTIKERSNVDEPAFEQWGTAPQKADWSGNFGEFEITFKGQHYNVTENGTVIEPQVEEYEP